MDISILLALQEFRNGAGAFLTDFMFKMTFLGEVNTVLVIMAAIYWCISKDFGTYLLMGWSGNRILNGALKVTVCAYRPWIRDARIIPYGDSINTATGYSFPSGHTMNASTVFGGGAVRKDLPRICGTLVMWLTLKLMQWVKDHPEKDVLILCVGIALAICVAVYAGVKPYPELHDAEGKLVVDGHKMANDTFKGVGWCSAFLVGWILERRFVSFSTDIPMVKRISRLAVGLLFYYIISLIFVPPVKGWIPGAAGTITSCFIQMFYVSFVFPWCIRLLEAV